MIKKFGDWDKVTRITRGMGPQVKRVNEESLEQVALKAEGMAVKFIRDQSLSWRPLSPQYIERKRKAGLSTKIMIATSTYMQSVTSIRRGYVSFAGVLKSAKTKEGESLANVGAVMEYGSRVAGIEARPLWQPVYKHTRMWLRKTNFFTKRVMDHWLRR